MIVQTKCLLGVSGWQLMSLVVLCNMGNLDNGYLSFSWGPQPNLKFLNLAIDNWNNYIGFMCWIVMDTIINTGGELLIYPWITNEVMDKKTIFLTGSYKETLAVSTGYEFYSGIRGVFMIYFSFTQIDFLFVKIVLDTLCQFIISRTTLKKKVCGEIGETLPITSTYGTIHGIN